MFFYFPKVASQSLNTPHYQFKKFTTDDGLSSNVINCVYKDSRGFLWIGTDRGPQRFNGSNFLSFRHLNADSTSISNEDIFAITEDRAHDIWFNSRDGVTKFNYQNGKLTNYRYGYKDGKAKQLGLVLSFFEDSKGRFWLGTVSAGLFLFDKEKQQFIHVDPAGYLGIKSGVFDFVYGLQESSSHEFIFSVKDGFVIIEPSGKQQYIRAPVPENKKIVYQPVLLCPLLKDHPDEIWISSQFNGLLKYDRKTQEWKKFPDGKSINPVAKLINWSNDEWMCCYKFGAYIFNHRTGVFTEAFNSNQIMPISDIHKDNSDNIWLSSNQNGLYLLNLSRQLYASTQSIPGWLTDRLLNYDSSKQTLYSLSAYHTSGIISYNILTKKIERDSLPGAIRFHQVINNFVADNDMLYLARWGGMSRYNLNTRKLDSIVYRNGTYNSQKEVFFDVCRSADKIYFAGGGKDNPYEYDKVSKTVKGLSLFPEQDSGKNYNSNSLLFHYGILYVGANYGASIYCYNEATGEKYAIPIPASYLKGNIEIIQSMCVDKQQNLWCSAGINGLYIYNIPSRKWIKHVNQQDDNLMASVFQLVSDEDGNVWCNSSAGLYVFNTQNFHFKNYNLHDGLITESNGGYLIALTNHQLACNNIAGIGKSFGIINTYKSDDSVQIIPISLVSLKVLGRPFLTDTLLDNVQQVTFPPNNNAFSLGYAGVAITAGKQLLYSYRLEGVEKNWHEVGNEQNLSYVNLDPGDYILHIKCKSPDGKINSKERLLYITMLPAWYQTWWFRILCILAILLSLFLATRYYFQQKIKKQQALLEKELALHEERNRIAADMHDDVGAGLSRIRYITSGMKDQASIKQEDIDRIVSLSDESVEKMNEIIWALNQGNQQLEDIIYFTRSQCSEMISNAGLEFSFSIPDKIPLITIAWKDCRNIYLLVKEAVNNAIKHASAKKISIHIEFNDGLLIQVSDDGIGFSEAALQRQGNGLLNYKKRIESLKGKYALTSSDGNGTALSFEVPLAGLIP